MRLTILAMAMAVAATTTAAAQTRSHYDWRTGNQYMVSPTPGGGASVRGYNFNNGTMWNNNIDRRGNQNGFDSRGNMWRYDSGSNVYQNFGTGKTCVGQGYARICN